MLLVMLLVNLSPFLSSADVIPLRLVLVAELRAATEGPVIVAPVRPLAAVLHQAAGQPGHGSSGSGQLMTCDLSHRILQLCSASTFRPVTAGHGQSHVTLALQLPNLDESHQDAGMV
jgi:hypothetical protein